MTTSDHGSHLARQRERVGKIERRREDAEKARTHALASLRQATWDASQFLSADETRGYVESVLREIESDQP